MGVGPMDAIPLPEVFFQLFLPTKKCLNSANHQKFDPGTQIKSNSLSDIRHLSTVSFPLVYDLIRHAFYISDGILYSSFKKLL